MVLDAETASTIDLPTTGAHKYAEERETRVLCVGWKKGSAPTRLWRPPSLGVIPDLRDVDVFVAHNVSFEISIWQHKLEPLGWGPVPPLERWSCTMARSSYHGLPAALEDVAHALRLPAHLQKDAAGRRVMLQLMRPRTWSPTLTWWHETDPAKYDALCRYCVRDVDVEAHLDAILPELPDDEHELWRINQEANDQGVHLDIDLMKRMGEIVRNETRRLNQELAQVTGNQLTSVNQVQRIREWLLFEEGLSLDVLDRRTVADVLLTASQLPKRSRRVLEIRAEAAKTSTAKINAMWRSVSADLQARGLFRYYGASRTGRYSSQRVQLHNMARPTIRDVPVAIDLIKHGADGSDLNLMFDDSALGVVSSCLRGCVMARPGHLLVIADLAQIEARVIAWLAREVSVLSVFASGQDVYVWTAAQVGSNDRQLGKVMVLALGFGMGPWRFIETAAGYGIMADFDMAQDLVWSWRAANPNICQFWWDLEAAALRIATAGHGFAINVGCVELRKQKQAMVIRLPSGRDLFYQRVGTEWTKTVNGRWRRQVVYEGINQLTRRWELLRAWPGKLAENVTQAVARDALAHILRVFYAMGLRCIGSVHDEPIVEVIASQAQLTLTNMLAVMRRPPPWGHGLPVHAEGRISERYGK